MLADGPARKPHVYVPTNCGSCWRGGSYSEASIRGQNLALERLETILEGFALERHLGLEEHDKRLEV
jgi:hypothetical protein